MKKSDVVKAVFDLMDEDTIVKTARANGIYGDTARFDGFVTGYSSGVFALANTLGIDPKDMHPKE